MILNAGNHDHTESITLQICTWFRVYGSSHIQNQEKDRKSVVYWFRKKLPVTIFVPLAKKESTHYSCFVSSCANSICVQVASYAN